MRLTHAVRIGGQLALFAWFTLMSCAYGNSLTYFYGYSSPSLAAWQNVSDFGGQNVSFVSQVPMVSQVTSTVSTFAPVSSANDSLYSSFGDVRSNSDANLGGSALGWQPVSMGGASYAAASSLYGSSNLGGSGSYGNPSSYTSVNGSLGAWFGGSTPQGDPAASGMSGWQPVVFATMAPVTNNFTSPTVITPPVVNTNPVVLPGANNGLPGVDAPEPATFGFMAAGLAGLLLLRKRFC